MTTIIRDARAGDAPGIADSQVAAWRVAYRGLVADEMLDSDEFQRARLDGWTRATSGQIRPDDDPVQRLIVPEIDGRIVGFAIFGHERDADDRASDAERGELYGFYLHPDVWGSGAADLLMDECLQSLGHRFPSSVLWVLGGNSRARRFYERCGWSCGTGSELVTSTWAGPVMPGTPELDPPLAEVQYRIDVA